MIIKIQTRDDNGRYVDAIASDFCVAAFRKIESEWGWDYLRIWLCRFCLNRAADNSENQVKADLWISRFTALRSIK